MRFYLQKVKWKLHFDIITFWKTENIFLAIIQHNNSEREGEMVTVFDIWSDRWQSWPSNMTLW